MLFLAQIGGSGEAVSVPRLPDPPALAHYFLENPWPVAIAAAVTGVVVSILARRQAKAAAGTRVMFAGIALACAVLLLGYIVTTEREVLRQRTRELADSAAAGRTVNLQEFLTEQARIAPFSPVYAGARGRDDILRDVRAQFERFGPLETYKLGPVQAIVDGPNVARTQVRVWAKPRKNAQILGMASGFWVRIDWRREREAGPWIAGAITIMQFDGLGLNSEMGRD